MKPLLFASALPVLLLSTLAHAQQPTPPSPWSSGMESAPIDDDPAAGGAPSHRRVAAIEITPLGLFMGHYGGSLEIVPAAHHALVLSAFYSRHKNEDPQFFQLDPKDPVAAPTNTFSGVGGEVGYRYYFGRLGPHGLYLGPSILLGTYSTDLHEVTFANTHVAFHDLGGAVDLGYQAIVEGVVLGIGVGAQYLHVDKDIPSQSNIFSDASTQSAVRPRANITVGYAF